MAETDDELVELPLDGVGTQLRRAREAAGLQLSDIAARTRIAERHLVMIENGNFTGMASRAYAVGFARSYARTIGMDEDAISLAVRSEMDAQEPSSSRYQPSSFEPGDPARVPAPRIAWVAALGAFAVVVLGYFLWRSFYSPAMSLPDLASEATQAPIPAASAPATTAQGPVVFTALEQGVWVKFYDAAGTQLMQKQMALGETYVVPPEANGPMIWTGRPDALQITVGGRPLAKLSDQQVSIKDVPVSAAALLARSAPPAVAAPAAQPSSAPNAAPAPRSSAAAPPAPARPAAAPTPSAAAIAPPPSPVTPPSAQSSTVSQ